MIITTHQHNIQIIQVGMLHKLSLEMISNIFCAGGMLTSKLYFKGQLCSYLILNIIYRCWRRNLHSHVKDGGHKCELYQTLLILMEDRDIGMFEKHMKGFVDKWQDTEAGFLEYFKKKYSSRAGMFQTPRVLLCYGDFWLQKNGPCVIGGLTIVIQTPTCIWKGKLKRFRITI